MSLKLHVNLTFACESMYLSKKNRVELDRLQSKLVKCLVGLNPMYRTTPLLKALDMKNIPHTVDINTLNMFHNVMKTHSGARTFYLLMLKHNIMFLEFSPIGYSLYVIL